MPHVLTPCSKQSHARDDTCRKKLLAMNRCRITHHSHHGRSQRCASTHRSRLRTMLRTGNDSAEASQNARVTKLVTKRKISAHRDFTFSQGYSDLSLERGWHRPTAVGARARRHERCSPQTHGRQFSPVQTNS